MPTARQRWWSTAPSATPGVTRKGRRYLAFISVAARMFYLGSFACEIDALRTRRRADQAKAAGLLDDCETAKDVRRILSDKSREVNLASTLPRTCVAGRC